MVTSAKGNALVIGNYKGRCDVVRAFRGTEFHLSETSECFRGLKHIVEEAPDIVVVHQSRSIADTCKLLRAVRCVTSAPIIVVGRRSEICPAWIPQYRVDAYLPGGLDPGTFLAYVHALLSKN